MEAFRLINMTDFVLQESKGGQQVNSITSQLHHDLRRIKKYANFLKQPLKLEMFVPVDEDGNFLEEPEQFKEWIKSDHYFNASESVTHECRMYKKAKEKVLFEGIDLDTAKYHCNRNVRTIEYFTSFNVELTPNAIKQLAL
jgi:hypothetical protein